MWPIDWLFIDQDYNGEKFTLNLVWMDDANATCTIIFISLIIIILHDMWLDVEKGSENTLNVLNHFVVVKEW